VNWKLILGLSLFGLVMGTGTVFVISSDIEALCWLAIFIVCAYLIAEDAPGKPFLHGLFLGLVNSVWVTGAHILFFSRYLTNHPREAAMTSSMPLPDSPRLMMGLVGPIVGLISGVIIGLFALVAAKLLKPRAPGL